VAGAPKAMIETIVNRVRFTGKSSSPRRSARRASFLDAFLDAGLARAPAPGKRSRRVPGIHFLPARGANILRL
jgi:hypothetical protein